MTGASSEAVELGRAHDGNRPVPGTQERTKRTQRRNPLHAWPEEIAVAAWHARCTARNST